MDVSVFVMTDDGYMGIGLPGMKVSDYVYVFLGRQDFTHYQTGGRLLRIY